MVALIGQSTFNPLECALLISLDPAIWLSLSEDRDENFSAVLSVSKQAFLLR